MSQPTQSVAFRNASDAVQQVSAAAPLPVTLSTAVTTEGTLTHFTKTVAATGTPEAMASAGTTCKTVVLSPLRTNTGDVYMGASSTNNAQHVIVPGVIVLDAPPGKLLDLSDIYLDVTVNGEGVGGFYIN